MRRLFGDEDGQAVIEYVLAVVLAVSIVAIIGTGFRRTLLSLWGFFAKEISAACPGCPPPEGVRFR